MGVGVDVAIYMDWMCSYVRLPYERGNGGLPRLISYEAGTPPHP